MKKKSGIHAHRFFYKLLKFLGICSLLASFGCDTVFSNDAVCMYGVPGNFFTVDGTVTDPENQPVKGIRITVRNSSDDKTDEDDDWLDFSETDEDGKFSLFWNSFSSAGTAFYIFAEDVDGEENGLFENKTVDVEFSKKDYAGKNGFGNNRYAVKDKVISLGKNHLQEGGSSAEDGTDEGSAVQADAEDAGALPEDAAEDAGVEPDEPLQAEEPEE